MDDLFTHIENAAHSGAFGDNGLPRPTEAECAAGNYKVGRASLHGLSVAIEQPRGTYRTGKDANGKRWVNRMAAHYGYISGTKGNDGDAVDCFIGFYPQSERVFVINQDIGGRFDEHKVMLGFPDEESARRAYLDSYDKGWGGLASIVPCSISQLKWWLARGDTSRPLRDLPPEGLETMTRKVQWNSDAQPLGSTLDQILYQIRCADAGEGLLMDAVTPEEITQDSEGMLALDALVAPYARLERKMELLRGIMERAGDKVKPVAMQITDPFKQRGVAHVAVIFELSDGQTVSIYFHNPDGSPGKMAPTDEVISWKWLLNKKDITIVVAPERGADLNVREVARRIMRLAEKNSPAFQRINAKRAERMGAIQGLKDEIAGLEAELEAAQNELEVAKVEVEEAKNRKQRAYADAVQQVSALQDAYLRATQNGGTDPKTGQTKEALSAQIDGQAAEVQRLRDIANGVTPAEPLAAAQPEPTTTTPDLSYRRSADGVFATFMPNTPQGKSAWEDMNATPGGENGMVLASHVESVVKQLRDAGYSVEEDTSPLPSADEIAADLTAMEEQKQAEEQALMSAYAESFGKAAAVLNAAVEAVNWDGIIDAATMRAELDKLNDASRTGQREIIGNASAALEAAGINTWDERLSGLRDGAGFMAWRDALEASRTAMDKIQAIAKEKLIEAGKAALAALPDDAPLSDMALAVYHKHGINMIAGSEWIARVVGAIEAKDADALRRTLAGVGSDSNKASMEVFERATGVKLAKTQRERGRQIDEWAGITPERRAEKDAEKDAARLARRRESEVQDAWGALKSMNVRNNGTGTVSDGQQYVLGQVAGGYDTVGSFKRGAATVYGLKKGSDLVFVRNRTFTNFLKAAVAFGGLRQALELVGAVEPKAAEDQGAADKIAAVDAAYPFESATDDFKLWLHESLSKADYSPFVTAKAMDEAVKRHGATVEWGKAMAALDGVDHAVASLEASLAVVENNAPINRAEGDIVQASLEADVANSIREAIATLTEADYAPSEEDIGGTFEAEAVTLDSTSEPPVKALLASLRSFLGQQTALDAVPSLDGTEHVGTIKLAGEAIGRIDIADDGKAMVYVGAAGDERVVFPSGARAMYSDDDAVLMVDSLFSMREAATPAPEVPYAGNDPDAPGIYKRDAGYLAVKQAASILGVAVQDAEADANLVINTSIAYGGKSLKVEISPHGWVNVGSAQIMIEPNVTAESTAADGKAIADAVKAQVEMVAGEGEPAGGRPDPQKDADRALFQSVIDGTAQNILAPELADELEVAYLRNQEDPEAAALFEQAVIAYQAAMMAATSSLA